jgi:hypothetical protein
MIVVEDVEDEVEEVVEVVEMDVNVEEVVVIIAV